MNSAELLFLMLVADNTPEPSIWEQFIQVVSGNWHLLLIMILLPPLYSAFEYIVTWDIRKRWNAEKEMRDALDEDDIETLADSKEMTKMKRRRNKERYEMLCKKMR